MLALSVPVRSGTDQTSTRVAFLDQKSRSLWLASRCPRSGTLTAETGTACGPLSRVASFGLFLLSPGVGRFVFRGLFRFCHSPPCLSFPVPSLRQRRQLFRLPASIKVIAFLQGVATCFDLMAWNAPALGGQGDFPTRLVRGSRVTRPLCSALDLVRPTLRPVSRLTHPNRHSSAGTLKSIHSYRCSSAIQRLVFRGGRYRRSWSASVKYLGFQMHRIPPAR